MEYASERCEIVEDFTRILKPNGIISIIKHNHAGRIIQKVVYENNFDEAISLLDGGETIVEAFGKVNYYNSTDILSWAEGLTIYKECFKSK